MTLNKQNMMSVLIVLTAIVVKCLFVGCFAPEAAKLSNFFVETSLLSMCMFLTERKYRWCFLPLVLISAIQAVNLLATGALLVSQTLLNLREYDDLGEDTLIKVVCQFVIYLCCFCPEFFVSRIRVNRKVWLGVFILFLSVEMLKSKMPLRNFFKVSDEVRKIYFFHLEANDGKMFFKTNISEKSKIPFSAKGKNVILLFAESWSSVATSKEVTPNLYHLKNESVSFEHYFNHAFATYRGLYGQLISGYMMLERYAGGDLFKDEAEEDVSKMYANKTESFVSILSQNKYYTQFMSCENKNSYVARLMRFLNYDKVVTAEDFSAKLTNLSDREMYKHLFDEATKLSRKKSKFLLTAHIGGTHYGMDSPDKIYKNGKNSILNTYYNQDYWLGEFLRKFKKSPLAKNTIIVFTADHSAFISPLFTKAFGQTADMAQANFVSYVPLIIYKKGEKPLRLDAKNQNSLALVPTILDLLEIRKANNHFLGNSLFDVRQSHNPLLWLTVSGAQLMSTATGTPKDVSDNKDLQDMVYQYYGYLER